MADPDDDDVLDEDSTPLAVLDGPGMVFEYEFDFGSGQWTHVVIRAKSEVRPAIEAVLAGQTVFS